MGNITGVIINSQGDMIATLRGWRVTRGMKQDAICAWQTTRDMNGVHRPVNVRHYRITTAKRYLERASRRDDLANADWKIWFWLLSE